MKKAVFLFIGLFSASTVVAQYAAMDFFNTSHFARAMRLGNVYGGVAEGPETMFYNIAGLADHKSYSVLASSGQGMAFYVNGIKAYDLAVTVPLNHIGTMGASVNTLSYETSYGDTYDNTFRIYSLNYANRIIDGLNAGISFNYYYVSLGEVITVGWPARSITGSAFDVSLAALYKVPAGFSSQDICQIGFQLTNVLGSEMSYEYVDQKDRLYQNMRAGVSYTFIPELKPIGGSTPFKFMLAFDAVYMGSDYRFTEWQPNFAFEMTFLEILQTSFGRENEEQIKQTYSSSPQHPVNRYGFGLRIPVDKLFRLNYEMNVKFDYCKSDWKHIEERTRITPFLRDLINVQENALSIGVEVKL